MTDMSHRSLKFARLTFAGAAIYGLLTLLPMYFLEDRIGVTNPPAITHPEFYYGFLGVALAWQVLFLLIAANPARLRLAMIPAVLEKIGFALPSAILYLQGRVVASSLMFAIVDLLLGVLFAVSFHLTRDDSDKWAHVS